MTSRRVAAVTALILTWATSARAQVGVPQEDQDACRPDVFRLCMSEIPNEAAIVGCLNAKQANLSPQCRAVMMADRPARGVRHATRP